MLTFSNGSGNSVILHRRCRNDDVWRVPFFGLDNLIGRHLLPTSLVTFENEQTKRIAALYDVCESEKQAEQQKREKKNNTRTDSYPIFIPTRPALSYKKPTPLATAYMYICLCKALIRPWGQPLPYTKARPLTTPPWIPGGHPCQHPRGGNSDHPGVHSQFITILS